jgi:hypothetical protein
VGRVAVGGLRHRTEAELAEVQLQPVEQPSVLTPAFLAASAYGPISQGHTVPWW